jgi:hypothetical protein
MALKRIAVAWPQLTLCHSWLWDLLDGNRLNSVASLKDNAFSAMNRNNIKTVVFYTNNAAKIINSIKIK